MARRVGARPARAALLPRPALPALPRPALPALPRPALPGRPGLPAASRKLAIGLGVAGLVLVAGVGALGSPAAGRGAGAMFDATPAPVAAASAVSDTWAGAPIGLDPFDVTWKALLVLVLLFVTLRVLARVQGPGRSRHGNLAVLESTTLAPKASLHLVAVGERRLVVGLTPSGMVALTELDAAELPESAEEMAAEAASAASAGAAAGVSARVAVRSTSPQTAFDAVTRPLVAPVDRFADKLASMMRGSPGGTAR